MAKQPFLHRLHITGQGADRQLANAGPLDRRVVAGVAVDGTRADMAQLAYIREKPRTRLGEGGQLPGVLLFGCDPAVLGIDSGCPQGVVAIAQRAGRAGADLGERAEAELGAASRKTIVITPVA